MVGINAGREFRELHHVDQFALCGISPGIRLSFHELRKQAIRVSVLLHDDFKKPRGVIPPFSSATANDLKGWLQAQTGLEDQSRAVKSFYANDTGHRGLVWQPYLKGADGSLLPRTDPAIWKRTEIKSQVPSATCLAQNFATGVEWKGGIQSSEPGTTEEPCDPRSYSIRYLYALAKKADQKRNCIAIACLPNRQGRIVTVGSESEHPWRYGYWVENIDVRGRPLGAPDDKTEEMTFEQVLRENFLFLGPFIGAAEDLLRNCAMALLIAELLAPSMARSMQH